MRIRSPAKRRSTSTTRNRCVGRSSRRRTHKDRRSSGWRRTSWATASLVIAVTVAIGISRWFERRDEPRVNAVREVPASGARESRRQLQLITPGGTRLIWVFNEDFKP
jgi:anti-sigma-K factor RskA